MQWQYKTILFEFRKDSLLGDKYVDDEDMEKTLNQLGGQGWELVDITLLQDGVLAFLKKPLQEERTRSEAPRVAAKPSAFHPNPVQPPATHTMKSMGIVEPEPVAEEEEEEIVVSPRLHDIEPQRPGAPQRKASVRNDDSDFIGGIRIS
jgi:hypothetical protein